MSKKIRSHPEISRGIYMQRLLHFLLGFSSGLPLMLFTQTLRLWLVDSGFSIAQLAWPSLMVLPLTLKFLWAPALDRFARRFEGGMKFWMITMQGMMGGSVFLMVAFHRLENGLLGFVCATFLLAVSCATFDVSLDAYRIQVLKPEHQPWCMSLAALGYRCAMMLSGGMVVLSSIYWGWETSYRFMGLLFLVIMFLMMGLPRASTVVTAQSELSVLQTLKNRITQQPFWLLLFLITFKAGFYWLDDWLAVFLGPNGLGFSNEYIGWVNQVAGIFCAIFGVLSVPIILKRIALVRLLYWVLFMELLLLVIFFLEVVGFYSGILTQHSIHYQSFITISVCYEHYVFGFAGSVLVILLMQLVDKDIPASEFACYSSLTLLPRLMGFIAGSVIETWGWEGFFVLGFFWVFLAFLALQKWMRNRTMNHEMTLREVL